MIWTIDLKKVFQRLEKIFNFWNSVVNHSENKGFNKECKLGFPVFHTICLIRENHPSSQSQSHTSRLARYYLWTANQSIL